ncbi:lipopolysaccharide biosynthesis protein [Motiliproteus sp.]|uniref:lipopolysaccharide biosynthesis protein n=1 Tax=Motiliproteus sp. TaxID=1898955 RepID=UPI003BAC2540
MRIVFDKSQKIFRGFLTGSSITITEKGKSVALVPILISLIGIESYGSYVLLLLVSSYLSMFINCGMNVCLVRHFSSSEDRVRELTIALVIILSSSLLILSVWSLFSSVFSPLLNIKQGFYFYVIVIAIFESIRLIVVAQFRCLKEYSKIFLYVISFEVLEFFILLIVFIIGIDVSLVFVIDLYLLVRCVSLTLALLIVRPSLKSVSLPLIISRLKLGLTLIPKDIALWFAHNADRFIISAVLGNAALGIYSAIYKLASVIKLVSQPVSFISFPLLSDHWDKESMNDFKHVYYVSISIYLLLSLAVFLTYMIFSYDLLNFVDEDLVEYGSILIWLSLGLILHTVQAISGYYIFILSNKVATYTKIIVLVSFLGVFLQYVMITEYGLQGAAVSSFIIYFCLFLVVCYSSKKNFNRGSYG